MHPSIQYELMKTRVAGWHRQADTARLVQAAAEARRERRHRGTRRRGILGAAHDLLQRLDNMQS